MTEVAHGAGSYECECIRKGTEAWFGSAVGGADSIR